MTNNDAKRILAAYRVSGQDAGDRRFQAALERARGDAELGKWLAESLAGDIPIAEKRRRHTHPPALLKAELLGLRRMISPRPWWRHPSRTRAGAIGAQYGVQPLTFAVHAEYINRPAVVIVDTEGIVRFAYHGTFWGDRPTVRQLLDMLRSGDYTFEAPRRLQPATPPANLP